MAIQGGKKKYTEILKSEVESGEVELERNSMGLGLSGLSAGVDVAFSLLAMAITIDFYSPSGPVLLRRFLVAMMYSLGFVFVKIGGSELFTEHTTLAVFPVLQGRSTVRDLLRVWGLVYFGNLLGGGILATILFYFMRHMRIASDSAFHEIALGVSDHPWWVILVGGALAGWLMGLLSWLVSATNETIGQIVCIWLIATTIGLAQLPHSVVGFVEVYAGALSGYPISAGHLIAFQALTTLGNVVGGVIFAGLKYSHAVRGKR